MPLTPEEKIAFCNCRLPEIGIGHHVLCWINLRPAIASAITAAIQAERKALKESVEGLRKQPPYEEQLGLIKAALWNSALDAVLKQLGE